jgi:abortive infection bacteriophage resistance protein
VSKYQETNIKVVITYNVGENVEELNHSYITGGNVNWNRHSGKQLEIHKKENVQLP